MGYGPNFIDGLPGDDFEHRKERRYLVLSAVRRGHVACIGRGLIHEIALLNRAARKDDTTYGFR